MKKTTARLFIMAMLAGLLGACGGSNIFDCGVLKSAACSEMTPEEKAQQYIDEAIKIDVQTDEHAVTRRDLFTKAIEALESVEGEHASDLGFNSLLASVYSARGGMLLWDILKDQVFTEGASVSVGIDSPLIPGPEDVVSIATYEDYVDDVGRAIGSLEPFQVDVLADPASSPERISASLQIALYAPVHAFMSLKLLVEDSTGTFDPAKLEQMTDEQAAAFVSQVANSAEVVSQMSTLSDAQKAQVQKELSKISDNPGTAKEKIDQYLGQGGATGDTGATESAEQMAN